MRLLFTFAALLPLTFALLACDSSGDEGSSSPSASPSSSRICDPGETQSCVCPSGKSGAQTCNYNGSRWETCECSPDSGGGGGTGSTGGGQAGGTSGGGDAGGSDSGEGGAGGAGGAPPPEGALTAATLEAKATRTTEDNVLEYDVEYAVAAFDADGAPVNDIDSDAFFIEDAKLPDFDTAWSKATCTKEHVSGMAKNVSVPLVMDQSGSITGTDPSDARVVAAKEFLSSLSADDESVLFTFADGNSCSQYAVTKWGDFTHDHTSYFKKLDELATCEGGGTPLYDASMGALDYLSKNAKNPGRALVLFTDGDDTASTWKESDVIAKSKQLAAPLFTIGLSSQINAEVLSRMAVSTDGAFFYAGNMPTMVTAFRAMNHMLDGTYDIYRCKHHLKTTKQPGWLTQSVKITRGSEYTFAVLSVSF